MTAPIRWYLAYGSNMCRARLEARVGPCVAGGPAWLSGYDLRFHKRGRDGSGKCDAFATGDAADVVHGVLFGMNPGQCEALHGFEGPDYAVATVTVMHADGERRAFLYLARASAIDASLAPFDWYHAFVIEGARRESLPESYVARLAAVSAMADPDAVRARTNAEILKQVLR